MEKHHPPEQQFNFSPSDFSQPFAPRPQHPNTQSFTSEDLLRHPQYPSTISHPPGGSVAEYTRRLIPPSSGNPFGTSSVKPQNHRQSSNAPSWQTPNPTSLSHSTSSLPVSTSSSSSSTTMVPRTHAGTFAKGGRASSSSSSSFVSSSTQHPSATSRLTPQLPLLHRTANANNEQDLVDKLSEFLRLPPDNTKAKHMGNGKRKPKATENPQPGGRTVNVAALFLDESRLEEYDTSVDVTPTASASGSFKIRNDAQLGSNIFLSGAAKKSFDEYSEQRVRAQTILAIDYLRELAVLSALPLTDLLSPNFLRILKFEGHKGDPSGRVILVRPSTSFQEQQITKEGRTKTGPVFITVAPRWLLYAPLAAVAEASVFNQTESEEEEDSGDNEDQYSNPRPPKRKRGSRKGKGRAKVPKRTKRPKLFRGDSEEEDQKPEIKEVVETMILSDSEEEQEQDDRKPDLTSTSFSPVTNHLNNNNYIHHDDNDNYHYNDNYQYNYQYEEEDDRSQRPPRSAVENRFPTISSHQASFDEPLQVASSSTSSSFPPNSSYRSPFATTSSTSISSLPSTQLRIDPNLISRSTPHASSSSSSSVPSPLESFPLRHSETSADRDRYIQYIRHGREQGYDFYHLSNVMGPVLRLQNKRLDNLPFESFFQETEHIRDPEMKQELIDQNNFLGVVSELVKSIEGDICKAWAEPMLSVRGGVDAEGIKAEQLPLLQHRSLQSSRFDKTGRLRFPSYSFNTNPESVTYAKFSGLFAAYVLHHTGEMDPEFPMFLLETCIYKRKFPGRPLPVPFVDEILVKALDSDDSDDSDNDQSESLSWLSALLAFLDRPENVGLPLSECKEFMDYYDQLEGSYWCISTSSSSSSYSIPLSTVQIPSIADLDQRARIREAIYYNAFYNPRERIVESMLAGFNMMGLDFIYTQPSSDRFDSPDSPSTSSDSSFLPLQPLCRYLHTHFDEDKTNIPNHCRSILSDPSCRYPKKLVDFASSAFHGIAFDETKMDNFIDQLGYQATAFVPEALAWTEPNLEDTDNDDRTSRRPPPPRPVRIHQPSPQLMMKGLDCIKDLLRDPQHRAATMKFFFRSSTRTIFDSVSKVYKDEDSGKMIIFFWPSRATVDTLLCSERKLCAGKVTVSAPHHDDDGDSYRSALLELIKADPSATAGWDESQMNANSLSSVSSSLPSARSSSTSLQPRSQQSQSHSTSIPSSSSSSHIAVPYESLSSRVEAAAVPPPPPQASSVPSLPSSSAPPSRPFLTGSTSESSRSSARRRRVPPPYLEGYDVSNSPS